MMIRTFNCVSLETKKKDKNNYIHNLLAFIFFERSYISSIRNTCIAQRYKIMIMLLLIGDRRLITGQASSEIVALMSNYYIVPTENPIDCVM